MKRSTCVYLIRDGKWLMLLRDRKKDDVNHGKWIGVGGKCLSGESFEACAIRETKEEAEAYLAELENRELDSKALDKVAGGIQPCWENCPDEAWM